MRKLILIMLIFLTFGLTSCEDNEKAKVVKEVNQIFNPEKINEHINNDLSLKDVVKESFPSFELQNLEIDNAIVTFSGTQTFLVPIEFYLWQNKDNRNLYFSQSFKLGNLDEPLVYVLKLSDFKGTLESNLGNTLIKKLEEFSNVKLKDLKNIEDYQKVFTFKKSDFKKVDNYYVLDQDKFLSVLSFLTGGTSDILNFDYLKPELKLSYNEKINEVYFSFFYDYTQVLKIGFDYDEKEFTNLNISLTNDVSEFKFNADFKDKKLTSLSLKQAKENDITKISYRLNNKEVPLKYQEAEKDAKNLIDLIKELIDKNKEK